MFDDVLIESAGKDKKKGGWITALISAVVHFVFIGAVVAAGYYVKENPEVIEKPIEAFVVASAPPPPPPPPPPASNSGATRPKTVETPRETPQRQEFRQPRDVPQDVPDVADVPSSGDDDDGGVPGGVVGGVKGGVVGGVVGGVIGGVVGGTLGGQLGGELGASGDTPVRVGGNVKAPTIITRVDPDYTEIARKARIAGVVIIEAVIDRQGNVTEARILKPLPMGLDQQALAAIRQWKFRPGTLNGQPVAVYYNLTVNFRLE
ncbi:MAG: periplasmic protein TonB [Acidobacteriota bacterium]|jgi:protein TonB|nr:periplasmic protein TonB [Acidobacteriota bacterium]